MKSPLLKIENLKVEFLSENESKLALRNVSLSLHRNEILGIVGESGSGKSTLIKSIMRILPPPGIIIGGKIIFNGIDLLQMKETYINNLRWKKISFVKQKAMNSLNPVIKINEQLRFAYTYHLGIKKDIADKKINELIKLVNIEPKYLDAYPHELSGGMRQRVIIALALTLSPEIIIMDEPTTALDVITERNIILEILDLQKKIGFSIIFITHDFNLLLEFADNICVLKNGNIVDNGSRNNIKNGGNHSYTKELLNSIPKMSIVNSKQLSSFNSPKLISVENLNVQFNLGSWVFPNSVNAVNNVSFIINKKEIVSLVGESGSGKTTIAKVLSGIYNLSSGNIYYKNDKLIYSKDNLYFRKKIQLIFQDPYSSLNPIHTVFHHLKRPMVKFGINKNKSYWDTSIQLLESVGLFPAVDFLTKYPHEMSGGECQRVSIARALIPNPELLIADEPTSMLDVSIRKEIMELFLKLRNEFKLSILFITHDLPSATKYSERIIVLKKGEVIESGLSNEIINNPKHSYTIDLLNASKINWLSDKITKNG